MNGQPFAASQVCPISTNVRRNEQLEEGRTLSHFNHLNSGHETQIQYARKLGEAGQQPSERIVRDIRRVMRKYRIV